MSDEEKEIFVKGAGIVTCELHKLSVHNTIMLMLQAGKREISMVGGFKQWRKVSRTVKKGEKSIGSILVPIVKDDDDKPVYFRAVSMFDVSQTEEIKSNKGGSQ